jgi:thioester reductase-like protein
MTSERCPEDKDWNWVRPTVKTAPFVKFEDRGAGLLEIICLPGWPGKVMTNRDDGSYATRDLFVKHPTRQQAYKYFSRLDDTLTLVNGEKANPLLIEGLARQNADVREVVAFGAGRSQLGLLLFPTPEGAKLSREELLRRIGPSLERAHADIPEYAHITPNMVKVLSADATYRTTDKGTIIRQAIYKQYALVIDSMYDEDDSNQGEMDISGTELQQFLSQEVRRLLGLGLGEGEGAVSPDADFFKLGMDSLRATQLRSAILSQIYLNGGKLGLNIAFDYPSVRALAAKLESVRKGSSTTGAEAEGGEGVVDVDAEMEQLVARFGTFEGSAKKRAPKSIVLTGATGSLGAHVACVLALREDVDRIYCLVRAKSPEQGHERVLKSLSDRRVLSLLSPAQLAKMSALPCDLSQPDLGLEAGTVQELVDKVTSVIHSAWSVNFNLRLSSFVDDCLVGARSLIDLCIQSKRQASYNFCSSVSTMANHNYYKDRDDGNGQYVPEEAPAKTSYAQNIGYAQSKLVAERLCMAAAEKAGIPARVLRIGQISGDSIHGVWNDTEAFPLILRTALTTGTLPRIDEAPRWLPLDIVARTVVDLAASPSAPSSVYNIINPRTFHWTRDLLPLLRGSGLTFREVSPAEWVANVRSSDPDPAKNPPFKLVEFFAQRYGGGGGGGNGGEKKQIVPPGWCTARTEAHSESFRNVPVLDAEYVKRMVRYWQENCW